MPEAALAREGRRACADANDSIGHALPRATATLARAGCETPRLDAEVLMAHVLGVDRARLVIDGTAELEPSAQTTFDELLARRAQREPVAYILGRRGFRHIELAVDRRVLIPRPETELLVEVGLSLPAGARVLDLGTGSGAVALALKQERPDLVVSGSDASEDALIVARENARRLGLEVRFGRSDLLEGLAAERFDAVLANLPYVAEGSELPVEIARYEPEGALLAGPDGLRVIRRLCSMLGGVPMVALEVGYDQAGAVAALLEGAGFGSVDRLRDIGGHERVIVGRR